MNVNKLDQSLAAQKTRISQISQSDDVFSEGWKVEMLVSLRNSTTQYVTAQIKVMSKNHHLIIYITES